MDKDEVWLSKVTRVPLNDVCTMVTPGNQTINHLIAITQALNVSADLLLGIQPQQEPQNILQYKGETKLMDQY